MFRTLIVFFIFSFFVRFSVFMSYAVIILPKCAAILYKYFCPSFSLHLSMPSKISDSTETRFTGGVAVMIRS